MNRRRLGTLLCRFAAVLLGAWLAAGCSGGTTLKKEPFFEKWQTMEETSRGHSPTGRPPSSDVRDVIAKIGPGETAGKPAAAIRPLPKNEVSLKMRQADVKAVLRSLALAAGLNILVKNEVKGEISVDFRAVPWDQAFTSILRNQGLTYEPKPWDGGIIRVMSLEDQDRDLKRRTLEMNTKWMEDPLPPVVIPIEYGDPKKIMDNLKDMLTKDKDGKPKGAIKVDEHSNSLIISAIRQDLEEMLPIIEKIDKPTHQILIKANIVEATKDTARNLGVQWGGMYGRRVGRDTLYVTPGGTTAGTATGAAGTTGVGPYSPFAGAYTPTAEGDKGIAGQGYGVNMPAAAIGTAVPGSLGLIFGTIGGNVLELQLSALQQDNKINILSSPSITTLDNQTAYTENGERVPYVSTATSTTGITQDVKFEDAVLRLEIKPHVIGEKNLKMDILVKKNEVDNTRNVLGNPYIIKKETKTTLIVQDGETIVISGLTKQRTGGTESGIPWLKSIPGLGWLFKTLGTSESMEEVLIFITPTILPPQGMVAAPSSMDRLDAQRPSRETPERRN
ncbi:MAG: Type IV pilus biogenesis and competence protein PilQ precursor [Syntrophaceae bacterium PtaB.Bin095]|nr:MAG: Type IV pilus biogenesis and competence protein PilQ precursor [Syntrophaceae bacterium PtaB.Bin095]